MSRSKITVFLGLTAGPFQDPLVTNRAGADAPQAMPTPGLVFNGPILVDNSFFDFFVLPPDTNGDVGPNHYVSSVNLIAKIFNKNGTIAVGPVATSSFFSSR
jgi:hypothetical protein